jgi:hypothetical protein
MIRIIKGNAHKVIGLQVNGKNYSVAKDLGAALALEEKANIEATLRAEKLFLELSNLIKDKVYVAEVDSLKIEAQFDSSGRIDGQKTLIEFKKDLSSISKKELLRILDDFVLALNRTQYQRNLDYQLSIKNMTDTSKRDLDWPPKGEL